ncbi:hypothetical protein PanWU01x14_340140 [Parasponia andersonii]|uniref:Uncharacterized protein n=1 Tax=Parasponia andersonii TaxID=3476 RepID=A0A2P5AEL1_PARAD|nr:hypothetical protein PanWU01x14_340140 [Parasponia andersonii]
MGATEPESPTRPGHGRAGLEQITRRGTFHALPLYHHPPCPRGPTIHAVVLILFMSFGVVPELLHEYESLRHWRHSGLPLAPRHGPVLRLRRLLHHHPRLDAVVASCLVVHVDHQRRLSKILHDLPHRFPHPLVQLLVHHRVRTAGPIPFAAGLHLLRSKPSHRRSRTIHLHCRHRGRDFSPDSSTGMAVPYHQRTRPSVLIGQNTKIAESAIQEIIASTTTGCRRRHLPVHRWRSWNRSFGRNDGVL